MLIIVTWAVDYRQCWWLQQLLWACYCCFSEDPWRFCCSFCILFVSNIVWTLDLLPRATVPLINDKKNEIHSKAPLVILYILQQQLIADTVYWKRLSRGGVKDYFILLYFHMGILNSPFFFFFPFFCSNPGRPGED